MSEVRQTVTFLHIAAKAGKLHSVEQHLDRLLQLGGFEPAREGETVPVEDQIEAGRFFNHLFGNYNLHNPYLGSNARCYLAVIRWVTHASYPSPQYLKQAAEYADILGHQCERYLTRVEISAAPDEEPVAEKPVKRPGLKLIFQDGQPVDLKSSA